MIQLLTHRFSGQQSPQKELGLHTNNTGGHNVWIHNFVVVNEHELKVGRMEMVQVRGFFFLCIDSFHTTIVSGEGEKWKAFGDRGRMQRIR